MKKTITIEFEYDPTKKDSSDIVGTTVKECMDIGGKWVNHPIKEATQSIVAMLEAGEIPGGVLLIAAKIGLMELAKGWKLKEILKSRGIEV